VFFNFKAAALKKLVTYVASYARLLGFCNAYFNVHTHFSYFVNNMKTMLHFHVLKVMGSSVGNQKVESVRVANGSICVFFLTFFI